MNKKIEEIKKWLLSKEVPGTQLPNWVYVLTILILLCIVVSCQPLPDYGAWKKGADWQLCYNKIAKKADKVWKECTDSRAYWRYCNRLENRYINKLKKECNALYLLR